MSKNHNNLIWIDMEMSGLNSQTDRILEIAIIITDPFLTILEEGPVLVLKQSDEGPSKNGCVESINSWKIWAN